MPGRSASEIVAECETYWRQTRVPAEVADELRSELSALLTEAEEAGRAPQSVVGRYPTRYAEAMASRYRVPPPRYPLQAPAERTRERWVDLIPAYGWIVPVLGVTILLMIFGPREETTVEDPDFWRWLWLVIAVVLGIGEMLTAGFFMLPFAIGAAIAAILAWANVTLPVQLVVFIVTSLVALFGLRRFAWSDREPSYPVGAKRFVNARAVVTEAIDPATGAGRVRLDSEVWGATTDIGAVIESGTPVRVVDVRGARLVVEPAESAPGTTT